MSREQELKYQLPCGVSPEMIFAHPAVAPLLCGKVQHIEMHSTYFDTPLRALQARRAALRIRSENERRVVTLKTAQQGDGALSTRGEWEVAAPDIAAGIALLARAGAPADILQTLAGQALCVIAQFSFTRHCAPVRMHALRATLCVDLGFLSPDGLKKAPLRELELELSEGEISSLRALGDTLAEAFSLTPEPRAKLCRAQEVL